ncbi:class I SAM-dependent methyltransferase [Chelatococcus reniformis]|uniref:class I SAM-dependent methyltransferase n=1 Tax=Chelatococcus reniformis TaxID=1494448 RepID=UPI001FCEB162|nr:methyltransferase domain-containing protein [Chelatococcus reniformis]
MTAATAYSPERRVQPARIRRVLNVGSGPALSGRLHAAFHGGGWDEVRLDIDPRVLPDLVGSMTDMRGLVADGSFDAVWSSHNVEHLYAHEVVPALQEFRRVLADTGFALITCPDLERVCQMVIADDLDNVAYMSPAGPITPLDMLFGHSKSIESGNEFMAHNTGFTAKRLGRLILEAGFAEARVAAGPAWDLWALGLMPRADLAEVYVTLRGTAQARLAEQIEAGSASA